MRILIDLQGAQTGSMYRGIGRYTLSMSKAIAKEAAGKHDIFILLNGLLSENIASLKKEFEGLLPQENIKVWNTLCPVSYMSSDNKIHRQIAESIREAFFLSLKPDVIWIPSIFEGFGDDAVTSIGVFDKYTPVLITIHDLIPLVNKSMYLDTYPDLKRHYFEKLEYIKKASGCIAVSEYTKEETIKFLGIDSSKIWVLYEGFDSVFQKKEISKELELKIKNRYDIRNKFILSVGIIDVRKNIPMLLDAFLKLNPEVRQDTQLVFAGGNPDYIIKQIMELAKDKGMLDKDIIFTGYVSDEDLMILYNICDLFIFPSWYEGFGLPPLEAMACGAPVLTADATSLPEVTGNSDALFDPFSVDSISEKINRVLTDKNFRSELSVKGLEQAKKFSWEESAKKIISLFEKFKNVNLSKTVKNFHVVNTGIFEKKHNRILLIKPDFMGDFILSIPSLRKIRAKYPYAHIDIILGSWNKKIAEELKIFDNIYMLDYLKNEFLSNPDSNYNYNKDELDKLTKNIGYYDLAIDLRPHPDSRFIILKVNSGYKVAYSTNNPAVDSFINVALPYEIDLPNKIVKSNLESISVQMLKLVDCLPADYNDYLELPDFKINKNLDKVNIALFLLSGRKIKNWGNKNFEKLIRMFINSGIINKINIYFANDNEKRQFNIEMHDKLKFYTGLNFQNLVASLKENNICISNDSFGAHIGSYIGLPVIDLFSGTDVVAESAPVFGRNNYVIFKYSECAPCHLSKIEDCKFNFACYDGITPEVVFEVTTKIIEALINQVDIRTERIEDINYAYNLKSDNNSIIDSLIQKIASITALSNEDLDIYLARLAICLNENFKEYLKS